MEPVEINAGTWYLRAVRADQRISDVPGLTALQIPDPLGYVQRAARGWHDETEFVWAVAAPTTGELVALVGIRLCSPPGCGEVWGHALASHDDAVAASIGPVTRFAQGALGLVVEPRDAPV